MIVFNLGKFICRVMRYFEFRTFVQPECRPLVPVIVIRYVCPSEISCSRRHTPDLSSSYGKFLCGVLLVDLLETNLATFYLNLLKIVLSNFISICKGGYTKSRSLKQYTLWIRTCFSCDRFRDPYRAPAVEMSGQRSRTIFFV
jgi:hypothetical protein